MKKLFILIIIIGSVFNSYAQEEQTRVTTAMPFLLITPDARAGGMADIGVATTADAFSIHHNAAKTVFNNNEMSLGLNYTPWLRNLTDDVYLGSVSFIHRFKETSAWGLEMKYFSFGEIQLTEAQGNTVINTGTENPNEFSINGIYSMKLSETFGMGVGLKYINSNYKINSTNTNLKAVNAFAVDVSGYYESKEENYGSFNGRYRFGFNIANLGPKVEYTPGRENFIPTNLKLGGGFDFILDESNSIGSNLEFTKLLVPYDANSKDGWASGVFSSMGDREFGNEMKEFTWAIGGEYKYKNAFSLRTGYFNSSELNGDVKFLSLGAGFKARSFLIDLSYLMNANDVNNPLENTLRFSLAFDFGEVFGVEK